MEAVKAFFGKQLFAVDGFKFTVLALVVVVVVVYFFFLRK
jgi:hypothetical protein